MDVLVQAFEWTFVFKSLGYISKNGIAGSYGNLGELWWKLSKNLGQLHRESWNGYHSGPLGVPDGLTFVSMLLYEGCLRKTMCSWVI